VCVFPVISTWHTSRFVGLGFWKRGAKTLARSVGF
jgi:hypothetical protein